MSFYGTYDYKTSPLPSLRASGLSGPIGELDQLHVAALLLHGERDPEVPPEQIERMKQAMLARGLPVEVVFYPGAVHQFDRGSEGGPGDRTSNGTPVAYNGSAAKDSYARTIAWFGTYLK